MRKILLGFAGILILTGCVETMAFIGPTSSAVGGGNVMRSSITSALDLGIKKTTGKSTFEHLRALYDDSSLDSDLERLREEMHVSIRDAVVAHESRVVKSHNGMAAIAVPIILLVLLAGASYWFFHRA